MPANVKQENTISPANPTFKPGCQLMGLFPLEYRRKVVDAASIE